MASGLPPPPLRDNVDSFSWLDWFNKLYKYVNTAGTIAWSNLNFSGSNLTDIQTRAHNNLQSFQGGIAGEYYHLTAAEHTNVQTLPNISGTSAGLALVRKSSDPTTSDISANTAAIYKNTTTGLVKLWVNDGGTMKSVTLI